MIAAGDGEADVTQAGPYAEVADPEPTALTFGSFIEEVARRHRSNVALSFGDRRLTYDELHAEVCSFARALIGAGAGKGTRVALLVGNRPEWPIAAYAVGMIGGVLIPVSTFAEPDEREYILRHSDAAILLLQDSLARHRYVDDLLEVAPEVAGPPPIRSVALPALRRVHLLGTQPRADERLPDWHELRKLAAGVPDELRAAVAAQVTVSDEAIIIYTSGTTAVPRPCCTRSARSRCSRGACRSTRAGPPPTASGRPTRCSGPPARSSASARSSPPARRS